MEIGKKVIELRKKYNFTQEKLAEKVGVSRQTLANWESDITRPDLEQGANLSKIFKISLDELVSNELEIVCFDNSDNIYKNLIGKECYISFDDDFSDIYLNCETLAEVLDVDDDFIKIKYPKKKEMCIKLIDMNLITAIKVIEEV